MKIGMIRGFAVAAVAVSALAVGSPAFADYIFQTATATGSGSGDYPISGDGTDANSEFIGATFSLTSTVNALQVGANVDAFGSGTVFAEIVAVGAPGAMPTVVGTGPNPLVSYLQSASLGSSAFAAPTTAGDVSTVINFNTPLGPGNYAVIFGAGGLFNSSSDGNINLTSGNATVGNPTVFASVFGDTFQAESNDIRIFAAPVPLPAALPLLLSGLGGMGFLGRRKAARLA